jgi:hypothetical protein
MGQMKRFAEEVSVQMGYGGEINDFVLEVARTMLPQAHKLMVNNPSPSCHNMVEEEDENE